MKEESTFKTVLGILKRRLNLRTLVILIVLLSVNSYAWFIYSTKVEGGVSARVKAWNVLFQVGDEEVSQNVNFNIDDLAPGMTNYSDSISVFNRGDSAASFSYMITSANILGTTYEISDSVTSADIQNILRDNYPFQITLGTSSGRLEPNSEASFSISASWPYESGDDEADTHWGELAYTYRQENPTTPSISINVTITAYQSVN